nr:MAG TPA: hypothetical protein [Caudoviricetes sp.]
MYIDITAVTLWLKRFCHSSGSARHSRHIILQNPEQLRL